MSCPVYYTKQLLFSPISFDIVIRTNLEGISMKKVTFLGNQNDI